jgi:hypothetical protein
LVRGSSSHRPPRLLCRLFRTNTAGTEARRYTTSYWSKNHSEPRVSPESRSDKAGCLSRDAAETATAYFAALAAFFRPALLMDFES